MSMTTAGRRLGLVRRAFTDRGFYFVRELVKQTDGHAAMDKDGEDRFLHCSRLRASGITSLNQGDVNYYDTQISPRNGREECVNVWIAK